MAGVAVVLAFAAGRSSLPSLIAHGWQWLRPHSSSAGHPSPPEQTQVQPQEPRFVPAAPTGSRPRTTPHRAAGARARATARATATTDATPAVTQPGVTRRAPHARPAGGGTRRIGISFAPPAAVPAAPPSAAPAPPPTGALTQTVSTNDGGTDPPAAIDVSTSDGSVDVSANVGDASVDASVPTDPTQVTDVTVTVSTPVVTVTTPDLSGLTGSLLP